MQVDQENPDKNVISGTYKGFEITFDGQRLLYPGLITDSYGQEPPVCRQIPDVDGLKIFVLRSLSVRVRVEVDPVAQSMEFKPLHQAPPLPEAAPRQDLDHLRNRTGCLAALALLSITTLSELDLSSISTRIIQEIQCVLDANQ